MLNKCNYQEDIEINIKKYDNLLTEIFPIFREKYFKTISEKRINEIKDYISDICKEEYLKIIKNKLPIWKNIKNEIHLRIKENIDSYLKNIFNQKQFKNEIDPNTGKRDYFFKIIPSDIINPSNFKDKERQKEIYDLIENEINNGIIIFNKNRDNLPLLNETINLKINTCSKLIDEHIEEVINQFSYLEEKFNLNSDYFFTLITKNQEIYKNFNNKIKEINLKLRELCEQKSKEYDSLVQKIKPSWNKIISEKISIIQNICLNFINNTFNNKYFKNDIKIDIDNLKQSIFSYSNLYKDIKEHKKKELDLLIEKEIQKTLEKINFKKNSMENWDVVQNQLIQKAIIEMSNKAKNNLNTVDFNTVVNILCNHIDKIPGFFDSCKINEKKNIIRNLIRDNAKNIASEYINKKVEEERIKREHERQINEINLKLKEQEKKRKDLESKMEEEKKSFEIEKIKMNRQLEEMEEERKNDRKKMNAMLRRAQHINELREQEFQKRLEEIKEEKKVEKKSEKKKEKKEEKKREKKKEDWKTETVKKQETMHYFTNNYSVLLQPPPIQTQIQSLPQTQPQPSFFSVPNYNGCSIVDALKSIGANSSYDYRSSIAALNGIGGGDYQGRPNENINMLNLLKEGKLKMP